MRGADQAKAKERVRIKKGDDVRSSSYGGQEKSG